MRVLVVEDEQKVAGALRQGLEAEHYDVDLAELVGSVSDALRVLADEKNQEWTIGISGHVPAVCDAAILRLAVTNVMYNAIKYTPPKGEIRVAARRSSLGDAVIEIQDTGPGIAVTHRERIFERFYRVDDARSRETGGVGLGLAIARWAVEANGGRIELQSDEQRGATFRIVLPGS
jgi:signal transduction histidine kinase